MGCGAGDGGHALLLAPGGGGETYRHFSCLDITRGDLTISIVWILENYSIQSSAGTVDSHFVHFHLCDTKQFYCPFRVLVA